MAFNLTDEFDASREYVVDKEENEEGEHAFYHAIYTNTRKSRLIYFLEKLKVDIKIWERYCHRK